MAKREKKNLRKNKIAGDGLDMDALTPALSQGEREIMAPGRGAIRFDDLSEMTRAVVVDVAKRMQCTREEIVEGLNQ